MSASLLFSMVILTEWKFLVNYSFDKNNTIKQPDADRWHDDTCPVPALMLFSVKQKRRNTGRFN